MESGAERFTFREKHASLAAEETARRMTKKPRAAQETPYPRDMVGYGGHPPNPQWPAGARIAVQI
ncbi:MAG: hypothetical protein ACREEE_18145, partial [Dongiaceae bacterium]